MSEWQLAQLNIAEMNAPLDSPLMAEFVANLERVNRLAESSAGFVWRLQTDEGDATALRPFGEDTLVNISVWRDVESLRQFVFKSAHADILRRRGDWFAKMAGAYTVLWWVASGHQPDEDEAWQRLQMLRQDGATAQAFGFRQTFPPP